MIYAWTLSEHIISRASEDASHKKIFSQTKKFGGKLVNDQYLSEVVRVSLIAYAYWFISLFLILDENFDFKVNTVI